MESTKVKLAISTCPNDTFAFHGIMQRKVDWNGIDFEIELLDICQLNQGLFEGRFDIAKASFHAAAVLSDKTVVLPSGSALGFGVGPLLLAAKGDEPFDKPTSLTMCPGQHTTAAMLFRIFFADELSAGKTRVEHCLFSEIMPMLQDGRADYGVCIHEGRFTWEQQGLSLVEDLGTRWESETDSPLPLGGILARRSLPTEIISTVQGVIRDSVQYGLENRDETLQTMRAHAQEFDDDVLFSHVDLYVNDWTVELGDVGRKSLGVLSSKAKRVGLIPADSLEIEVFG